MDDRQLEQYVKDARLVGWSVDKNTHVLSAGNLNYFDSTELRVIANLLDKLNEDDPRLDQ
jgi:uncharacterized protein YhbP (UPF0306 family)